LIPTTPNIARTVDYRGMVKNAYYICFRGVNTAITPLSRDELLRANQIAFLKDVSYIAQKIEGNPQLSSRCDRVVQAIESGRSPFALTATLKEIDRYVMLSNF